MSTPEGVKFLAFEDELLLQIVQSFAQLDPVSTERRTNNLYSHVVQFNGTQVSDPIFSEKRIANTLTYGYLEMLGTLSKQTEGLE